MSHNLEDMIAYTAEAMGSTISAEAIELMVSDLLAYPAEEVTAALTRVRKECHGHLALAHILERMPSWQRSRPPTADEAWEQAIAARIWDEDATVILHNAIMRSWPHHLWNAGDKVAARRAFIDAYERERHMPDAFEPDVSLGYDASGRTLAIEDAVRAGKLPASQSQPLLEAPADQSPEANEQLGNLMRDTVKTMRRDRRQEEQAQREPAPAYQEGELLPSDPFKDAA